MPDYSQPSRPFYGLAYGNMCGHAHTSADVSTGSQRALVGLSCTRPVGHEGEHGWEDYAWQTRCTAMYVAGSCSTRSRIGPIDMESTYQCQVIGPHRQIVERNSNGNYVQCDLHEHGNHGWLNCFDYRPDHYRA